MGLICFTAGFLLSYYVECGTAYYLPGLCYRPLFKNWSPTTADTTYLPAISADTEVTQSFMPECNGLTEIRIWVDAHNASPSSHTNFIIKDGIPGDPPIQNTPSTDQLKASGWYTIDIPPDWTSSGKTYSIDISGIDNTTGDTGPSVAVYTLTSVNTRGDLLVNGEKTGGSMIFQYGCVAGLSELTRK